ncbi:hypothetical protein [Streptomyces sp. NPDC017964]|uniref:hypothetical protein n=1 Tax=Streptomyces sp. NPDC017964 TaxID=3365022 RepID=UPI0037B664EC
MVGTIMLAAGLGIAFLGPVFRAQNPAQLIATPRLGPSVKYPLGTDDLGRDLFSRVLSGGVDVVLVPLLATAVAFIVGAGLGMDSGYVQGRFDLVITRSSRRAHCSSSAAARHRFHIELRELGPCAGPCDLGILCAAHRMQILTRSS